MKNSGARVSRSFTNFSFDDVAKAFLDFVFEYNLLAFDWNVLSGFDLDQSPSAGPTGSSLDIMCTQWVVLEGDLLKFFSNDCNFFILQDIHTRTGRGARSSQNRLLIKCLLREH